MIKKTLSLWFAIVLVCVMTIVQAANTIQKGNLIIDLDTGEITIANDNAEYQSLLEEANSTTTGWNSTGAITNQTWSTNGTTTTGTTSSEDSTTSNMLPEETTSITPIPVTGTELQQAVAWWYNNGLTMYATAQEFWSDLAITREQSAKFFVQATEVLGYNSQNKDWCSFADITNANTGLQPFILEVCTQGLMQGSKGNFLPLQKITHAEGITVISRIAGYTESIITSPRRTPYLQLVKSLWILKNTNTHEMTMDKPISRWELIILLYKLSKQKDSDNNYSSTSTGWSIPSNVSIGVGISDDPEFMRALLRMNKASMTKYYKANDYGPFNTLTRGQAAQFLTLYDQKFDNHDTIYKGNCIFEDTESSNFITSISYICNHNILKGNGENFRPNDAILKSEFIAGILNMIEEDWLSTWSNNRANDVYNKALSLELIGRSDESTFTKPVTRYEVALILSKMHLKDQFAKALASSTSTATIISPLEQDETVYTANQEKVFIDINSIDSREFTNWFVTLFGTTYKLVKKQTTQYFPTSYVWYGELLDATDDTRVGSLSMSIGQKGISKSLIEWYILLTKDTGYYTIESTNDVIPYYVISKQSK